uniref:Replication factor C subunit 5 n=1 Tax=Ascaris suum TaxID=6253 RepID=F1LEU8_ASCSU
MNFAQTKTLHVDENGKSHIKLIILDEADAMTKDAQNALRRVIEKFTENVRFCIICNYLSKIIPAVQSRCTRFRFAPLKEEQILPRLRHIAKSESLKLTEDGERALMKLAGRALAPGMKFTYIHTDTHRHRYTYICATSFPKMAQFMSISEAMTIEFTSPTYNNAPSNCRASQYILKKTITNFKKNTYNETLTLQKNKLKTKIKSNES